MTGTPSKARTQLSCLRNPGEGVLQRCANRAHRLSSALRFREHDRQLEHLVTVLVPQVDLDRRQDKRMIVPSEPGALLRSADQGIDIWTSEKASQGTCDSLPADTQNALDL